MVGLDWLFFSSRALFAASNYIAIATVKVEDEIMRVSIMYNYGHLFFSRRTCHEFYHVVLRNQIHV